MTNKKICLIHAGGTIGMTRSERGYVTKRGYLKERLEAIADLYVNGMPEFELYEMSPLLDSSNMSVNEWNRIGSTIAELYDGYDGFVILHGTDTMAYTAAALSYLIQDSPKPIVLTGAQKPIWFDGTDSKRNLTDAFVYACRGGGGVQIVFNGRVILGTRARKTYSKSFQAFSSVNYPLLATVQDGELLQYIKCEARERPLFFDRLNTNVGLLKLAPGTSGEVVKFMTDKYDGLIIEGFGVGGLPEYSDFYSVVSRAADAGKLIVMTTQVPNEGSDLSVYHVGGRLKSTVRLLEAYDMTTESALTKLMWIMGQTRDFDTAKRLFYTPVAKDILYSIHYATD